MCLLFWPAAMSWEKPKADHRLSVLRPQVTGGLGPDGIAWAFTSLYSANWLPLTRLSWMLDAELFGMTPTGFHATSLVLHVANAVLLLLAFTRLTGAFWPSAFVAFVFALHPLHVESVAWASARKDLLSGLFFMLALLAHERVARSATPGRWKLALAGSLALGLMSKPMLVTLPFVLLLLDVWPLGRWRAEAPLKGAWPLFREKAPLFVLVLLSCIVTLIAQQHAMASDTSFPPLLRLVNSALAVVDYVTRAVWPLDLAVLYPMPKDVGSNRVVIAVFAVAIASVIAWRALPARPWIFVGWAWFLGMLVPVIGLVQVGVQASADRYTYLPLIGLSVIPAWGVRERLSAAAPAARRAVAVAAALSCVALAGLTWRQVGVWQNGVTLFEHTLAVTGTNPWAEHFLGYSYLVRGEREAGLHHLEEALRLDPENERFLRLLERAKASAVRGGPEPARP